MKRKIITLLLAVAAASVVSTTAMADGETISGFYDIGSATNVVITPYAGETAVTASEKNIDSDDAKETVYVGSDRLDVTYSAATANEHYGVILIEGSSLPTKDSVIYYIDQETATSANISFNVYPKLPTETKDMTLYISSSKANESLISIPVNYAVNATEVATYTPGDANGDKAVDVKDVIVMRRFITGGYNASINEAASNVNGDATVDVKDVIVLRRFITGGYNVELK